MKIKINCEARVHTNLASGRDYTWTWNWDDYGPGKHITQHGFYMPSDMRYTKSQHSAWWPHGPTEHIMSMLRRVLK